VGNERIDYRTRQVDLLLCYSDGEHPGLVSTRLMPERIAPVCSAQYARQLGLIGNPDALRESTVLHDVAAWGNAAFDAEWQLWMRAAGCNQPLPSRFLTFDRSDLCSLAAIHHAGIAIGREQLLRERVASGELVLPFGDFVEVGKHGYYLVHPAHEPMPRRLQVLIEWLGNMAAHSPRSPGGGS
jgi:LysR family D-serine deaminase transcriptional activator